jgi:hypothetical protein
LLVLVDGEKRFTSGRIPIHLGFIGRPGPSSAPCRHRHLPGTRLNLLRGLCGPETDMSFEAINTQCLYFVQKHTIMVCLVGYRGYGRGYGRSISGGMGLGPNLSPYCRWSPGTPSRRWAAGGYGSAGTMQPFPVLAQNPPLLYQYAHPWMFGGAQQPQLAWPWTQPLYAQQPTDYGYNPGLGMGYGQGMGMRYRWGIAGVQAGYPY